MQCDKCEIKKICKVYDFIKEHSSEINFTIQCGYMSMQAMATGKVEISNVKRQPFNFLNDTYETEEAIDFKKREKKKIVKCKTCDGTDYEEYINKCSICGKEVCGNCGTSSDGRVYCEECWNNDNKQSIKDAIELTLEEEEKKDENY